MKYSIQKAWFEFLFHKKLYGLIIVIYAIGIFLFSACFNMLLSCQDNLRLISSRINNKMSQITYGNGNMSELEDFAISLEMLEDMEEQLGSEVREDMIYIPYVCLEYESPVKHEWQNIYILFMTSQDLRKLTELPELEEIPQNGYIGQEAEERLAEYSSLQNSGQQETAMQEPFYWEAGKLYAAGEVLCEWQLLEPMETGKDIVLTRPQQYIEQGDQFRLSECMILPQQRMERLYGIQGIRKEAVLQIDNQGEDSMRMLSQILKILASYKNGMQYSISSQVLTLQKASNELSIPYRNYLWAGVSILMVIMSGMIGIFILILRKRQKSNAVSIAYGATSAQIFWELCLEIFTIFLIGSVLGMLVSIAVIPHMEIKGLAITAGFHYRSIPIVLAVSAAETLIICSSAAYVVHQRNIAESLKEL